MLAAADSKGSRRNKFAFCCRPPGPLARRERRAIPRAVCEERATKPAGLRAAARRGAAAGRVSALLPLLDDVRHRLRRGASHLPARRSRQNVNLFLREPLACVASPCMCLSAARAKMPLEL